MLFDKRVLHSDTLAKYAAAFFRMSRSSVVRLSSAFKRLSSACIDFMSSMATGSLAALNFLTQVCSRPSPSPSRLATLMQPHLFAVVLREKFTQRGTKFYALRRCSAVEFLCCKCARSICKKKKQTVRNSLQCAMEARAGVEPTYTDLQSGA